MSEQGGTTVGRPDVTPSWQDLLTERLGDAYDVHQIIDAIEGSGETDMDAREVLDMMASDPVLRSAIAFADSVAILQIVGNERDEGWVVDDERSGPIGASVGVTWRYDAAHDWEPDYDPTKPNAELRSLAPTGRNLEAHGFSIFGVEDEAFQVRRYIDWAGLYAQLGLGLNWRIPVNEVPVLRRPDAGASDTTGDNASPPT